MYTPRHILTLARTCAIALVYACAWICLCAGMSANAMAIAHAQTHAVEIASVAHDDVPSKYPDNTIQRQMLSSDGRANAASILYIASINIANVDLTITATPEPGVTMSRVEIYLTTIGTGPNGTNSAPVLVTTLPNSPYLYSFTGLVTGTYTITARGFDSNGDAGSAALTINAAGAANETITFLHNDLAGSPIAATDATGAVIWKEDYTPYGERKQNEAASSNQHQWFGGKVQDSETGLSYFGARYYDPVVGRFMGVDAVGFNPGNLQSFNRYAYANNNPYRFVDPDGNEPVDAVMSFILDPFQKIGLMIGMNQHRQARDYGSSMQDGGQYAKANLDGVQAIGDVTSAAISVASLPIGMESAAVRGAIPSVAARSGLGDLTSAEAAQIQSVVNTAGRPLEVVGSAASGTRRGVGTNLPIGKGAGTRSDIDYLVPPSSMQHFEGLQGKLPGIDPKTGIIPGTANKNIGPAIRFEPTN